MTISILVPSLVPDAPVKGAVALVNELSRFKGVTLVCLKHDDREDIEALKIAPQVEVLNLGRKRTWIGRFFYYRRYLISSGKKNENVSISFCFSADIFNLFMRRYAILVSSVRGNLLSNYRNTYGLVGEGIALIQFKALRAFEYVVAMSQSMKTQLYRHGIKRIHVIGNFLDEIALKEYKQKNVRDGVARFIYVGRLVPLKKPKLLLDVVSELHEKGIQCQLDIVGDGPLYDELKETVVKYGLDDVIKMHGYVVEPYDLLQKCDYLVLPSISEGISRSVLEALFLDVPCIIRDVDAADEVIKQGVNGILFKNDNELAVIMERVAIEINKYRGLYANKNLLPPNCRQRENVMKYLELIGLAG